MLYADKDRETILGSFPTLKRRTEGAVKSILARHYKAINASDLLLLYDLFDVDMFMYKYHWPFRGLTA